MNCQHCSNALPNPQDRFCPFCGAENVPKTEVTPVQTPEVQPTQQAGTQAPQQPAQQAVQPPAQVPMQPAFQPQFQQPEKKSTPAWVIVLVVAVIVFFLALCCGGSLLLFNNLDDSPPAGTTGTTIGGVNVSGAPSDDEIVAHLEDRYGVSFRIEWSNRDSAFPSLELRPINQADMDFFFMVELADLDGNLLSLDEIEDGFLLALAESRAEEAMLPLAEDIFGQRNIDRISVFYYLEHSWTEGLPQSIQWDPDDGMDSLRQAIADEMSDGLYASITVILDESQDLDEISWDQVEEFAEKITKSDFYGISNSLSVSVGWDFDRKHISWRAQDGEMFSLERRDW